MTSCMNMCAFGPPWINALIQKVLDIPWDIDFTETGLLDYLFPIGKPHETSYKTKICRPFMSVIINSSAKIQYYLKLLRNLNEGCIVAESLTKQHNSTDLHMLYFTNMNIHRKTIVMCLRTELCEEISRERKVPNEIVPTNYDINESFSILAGLLKNLIGLCDNEPTDKTKQEMLTTKITFILSYLEPKLKPFPIKESEVFIQVNSI